MVCMLPIQNSLVKRETVENWEDKNDSRIWKLS
jgi:hypothetical protein